MKISGDDGNTAATNSDLEDGLKRSDEAPHIVTYVSVTIDGTNSLWTWSPPEHSTTDVLYSVDHAVD